MREKNLQVATFAAGCFWGVEEVFRTTPGIVETEVGYAGGTVKNPSYEKVSTGKTGHAESVRIFFDPKKISYEELVRTFFRLHDPTQVNYQGSDAGTQYRSVIFYHDDDQKRIAEAVKKNLKDLGKYHLPIATKIIPAGSFYRAEEYHQKYILKTGRNVC